MTTVDDADAFEQGLQQRSAQRRRVSLVALVIGVALAVAALSGVVVLAVQGVSGSWLAGLLMFGLGSAVAASTGAFGWFHESGAIQQDRARRGWCAFRSLSFGVGAMVSTLGGCLFAFLVLITVDPNDLPLPLPTAVLATAVLFAPSWALSLGAWWGAFRFGAQAVLGLDSRSRARWPLLVWLLCSVTPSAAMVLPILLAW